jgi:predicted phage tail protein
MTDALRTVRLYGELAREFGPLHRLAIASPAEAVRALCAIFPGFERHLISSQDRGVAYRVVNARSVVADLEHLHHPTGERGEVKIIPVLQGAKRGGLFQVILGVALIAASFFIPGTTAILGASLSKIAFSVGTSLVLGGISQMLTPTPKTQGPQERPENRPSYQFNGPVNTTAQGQPVPIGYGRLIVGSAVISAGITAVEVAP